MGYKDKEKQKEAVRKAVKKHRSITKAGITGQGITEDGTYFKDGIEMVPPLGTLPERPRYLVLSDGQVLDRAKPPKADLTLWPGWRIEALRRCNVAELMMPLMGKCSLIEGLRAEYDYRKP